MAICGRSWKDSGTAAGYFNPASLGSLAPFLVPSKSGERKNGMSNVGGWTKLPNVIVERMHTLTHAEKCLLMIMFRRQTAAGALISDSNWEKWTGLSSRQKGYAIAGLRDKGLQLHGSGDAARYTFELQRFKSYQPAEEVRTKGRSKAVLAPKGTLIHQDCKTGGCQMLCGGPDHSCGGSVVVPGSGPGESVQAPKLVPIPARAPAPALGAPVAGGNGYYVDLKRPRPSEDGLVSAPRKRETHGYISSAFNKSFAFLRQLFPTVGAPFVSSLLAQCEPFEASLIASGEADALLLRAIQSAWEAKKRVQTSEGLFMSSVPPVLASIRNAEPCAPRVQGGGFDGPFALWCARVSSVSLKVNGSELSADFSQDVQRVQELAALGSSDDETVDALLKIEESVARRVAALVASAAKLSPDLAQQLKTEVQNYRGGDKSRAVLWASVALVNVPRLL